MNVPVVTGITAGTWLGMGLLLAPETVGDGAPDDDP